MENAATDRATPTTVNSSVRTREYLTTAEIERLMAAWIGASHALRQWRPVHRRSNLQPAC